MQICLGTAQLLAGQFTAEYLPKKRFDLWLSVGGAQSAFRFRELGRCHQCTGVIEGFLVRIADSRASGAGDCMRLDFVAFNVSG
jgi:hypothetical protein